MEQLGRIIGDNLKRLRSEAGLSLDALASASGVSKSRLSQIERGEANPSVTTLWQIANALKVEFSTLITSRGSGSVVVSKGDVQPATAENGGYRVFPLFPFDPALGFEVYVTEIDPGILLDAEPHSPGTQETVVVSTGRLAMTASGEEHLLGPGDALRFAADAAHEYRNPGGDIASFDVIIAYPRAT